VLPLPPEDTVLRQFVKSGWITVHGGSPRTSLATLPAAAAPGEVLPVVAPIIRDECEWLAGNAINNRFPPPENLFEPEKVAEFRRVTTTQRNRAGRIGAALLIYAYSLEAEDPDLARDLRSSVRAWGSMANFLGDETALDYLSTAQFERFRENVSRWGKAVLGYSDGAVSIDELRKESEILTGEFFGSTRIRRAGN